MSTYEVKSIVNLNMRANTLIFVRHIYEGVHLCTSVSCPLEDKMKAPSTNAFMYITITSEEAITNIYLIL